MTFFRGKYCQQTIVVPLHMGYFDPEGLCTKTMAYSVKF